MMVSLQYIMLLYQVHLLYSCSYTVSQYSLNASQSDYKGVVPLALASISGSINAVEYLINTTNIDIDVTCDMGRTSLHYSCCHGNLELSQYLIEVQGSDISIIDINGWNALDHSAKSGNMALVQYLIKKNQLLLRSCCLLQAVHSAKLPLVIILVNEHKLDPHVKGKQTSKICMKFLALKLLFTMFYITCNFLRFFTFTISEKTELE